MWQCYCDELGAEFDPDPAWVETDPSVRVFYWLPPAR